MRVAIEIMGPALGGRLRLGRCLAGGGLGAAAAFEAGLPGALAAGLASVLAALGAGLSASDSTLDGAAAGMVAAVAAAIWPNCCCSRSHQAGRRLRRGAHLFAHAGKGRRGVLGGCLRRGSVAGVILSRTFAAVPGRVA